MSIAMHRARQRRGRSDRLIGSRERHGASRLHRGIHMTRADFSCGSCRAPLLLRAAQTGGEARITLAPNVRLHFNADDLCTAICASCGAATTLALPKTVAARLRELERTGDAPKPLSHEVLLAFDRGIDRYVCQLSDAGGTDLEARLFKNDEFVVGRRFRRRQDAADWARAQRDAIVKNWGIW
jgi:hypothetical protein